MSLLTPTLSYADWLALGNPPILETTMSTDLKATIDHLKRLREHFEVRVNEQRRRKDDAETPALKDWWGDQERKEQSDIVDPLVHVITLLESTGKALQQCQTALQSAYDFGLDDFKPGEQGVYTEMREAIEAAEAITAAMQKEEVAK